MVHSSGCWRCLRRRWYERNWRSDVIEAEHCCRVSRWICIHSMVRSDWEVTKLDSGMAHFVVKLISYKQQKIALRCIDNIFDEEVCRLIRCLWRRLKCLKWATIIDRALLCFPLHKNARNYWTRSCGSWTGEKVGEGK